MKKTIRLVIKYTLFLPVMAFLAFVVFFVWVVDEEYLDGDYWKKLFK